MLICIDFGLYGGSLWYFAISKLEIKDRECLWIILKLITNKSSTNTSLSDYWKKTSLSLIWCNIQRLKDLCLNVIVHSMLPTHTAFHLSTCIKELSKSDESRRNDFDGMMPFSICICHDLSSEIESDHLLAIMIETPSDIVNNLSIIDIAIDSQIIDFWDFTPFQPIFVIEYILWLFNLEYVISYEFTENSFKKKHCILNMYGIISIYYYSLIRASLLYSIFITNVFWIYHRIYWQYADYGSNIKCRYDYLSDLYFIICIQCIIIWIRLISTLHRSQFLV